MDEKDVKEEAITIPEGDKNMIFDLAMELTSFCCPTGFEDEIRKYIVNRFKDRCNVKTDKMGNVFVEVKGIGDSQGPKFMISAHIDEIGFMVSFITKEGFLRITPLGGQNYRILPGQRVTVFSEKGEFQGVIAEKPIHLLDADERKKLVKKDEIFVDIGASSKKKAQEFISVGDFLTFQRQCEWLGQGDIFSCKSGDDRIGTLVEILVLEYFIEHPAEWNVIGVFSTQEEIGTRGAITSAYAVDPDAALALEVTHAIDFPGISKEKHGDVVLGKGPSVAIGPNLHPKLTKFIIEQGKKHAIPFQIEVEPRPTGTDARAIQVTRSGVATSLISVPLRYMHTNIEVLSPVDIYHTKELVIKLIAELPRDFPLNL